MTATTALPVLTGKDPRTLVSAEVFDKLACHFAAAQEVALPDAERATGQFLIMQRAHADAHHDPEFGMLLPNGDSYRVVPTTTVDAVWHAALQNSEPYTEACEAIAGESCTTARS